ncbi:MAG TPA: hypothetical protein VKV73_27160 [Chloroflexota bacterium]|nr:hypothetical protein [Chloroflexota bacterium]
MRLRDAQSALLFSVVLVGILLVVPPLVQAADQPLIERLDQIKTIASTVPANGDVNPYGVAVVPRSIGRLVRGDVLVSNFNNAASVNNPGGLQGRGTTIVAVAPGGEVRLFAQIDPSSLPGTCPGGIGLTTALSVLPGGWVVVGSLPTTDGTSATAQAGCVLILNAQGQVVKTLSGDDIDGPWDLTAVPIGDDFAVLFVTNVLNGTVAGNGAVVHQGTVVRIVLQLDGPGAPRELQHTVIGSGFSEKTDPAALVIGPTGVGFGRDGVLYVADSVDNRIAAIANALFRTDSAGRGRDVSVGGALNDPLGLAIAPAGDILTVNGNDGFIVETTPAGRQVATRLLDNTGTPAGSGTLFGLAIAPERGNGVYFVDDGTNTLNLLH